MAHERAFWRDIEQLVEDFAREWTEREAALRDSRVPLAMQPSRASSVHSGLIPGLGGFVPDADVQIFTPAQFAQILAPSTAGLDFQGEWCKPPGTKFVYPYLVGAGGGAGSGAMAATGTNTFGGIGGVGGNVTFANLFADDLPGEVPLYVPAGGAGGVFQGTGTSDGHVGATPPDCMFGSSSSASPPSPLPLLVAGSGVGGSAGTRTNAPAGPQGSSIGSFIGASPIINLSTSPGNAAVDANRSAPSAGANGGGYGASGAAQAGGAASGGPCVSSSVPAAGGGAASTTSAVGGSGGNATNGLLVSFWALVSYALAATRFGPTDRCFAPGGGGGGGGGCNSTGGGGPGGNGYWGGGGGGGGGSANTHNTGAGGNGGDGFIIVVAW